MSELLEHKSRKSPDYANGVKWVKLKDGRRIAQPPEGGKFTREEIREAVKAAMAERGARRAG